MPKRVSGPMIKNISIRGNLMGVVYNDGLFICYDRRSHAIVNYVVAHWN